MIIEVNVSESMSEEKHILFVLVLISSGYLIRSLIYNKIKGDFSGYGMGIRYTHFLNGVRYGHIIYPLLFQGIYEV